MTFLHLHLQTQITFATHSPYSQPEVPIQLRYRQTSLARPQLTDSSKKDMPVSHTSARATTSTLDASWHSSEQDLIGLPLRQSGIATYPG